MDDRPKCEIRNHQNPRGRNLFDLDQRNFLLDTSPKARETKANLNHWDFIKIQSCCTAIINKTKRQHTDWEKISENDISYKGLVPKIYKELLKLNTPQNE